MKLDNGWSGSGTQRTGNRAPQGDVVGARRSGSAIRQLEVVAGDGAEAGLQAECQQLFGGGYVTGWSDVGSRTGYLRRERNLIRRFVGMGFG